MLVLEWNMDDALQARFEDGRDQGEIRRAEKIAIKMLDKNRPFDEIQEFTDLPLQRIKDLAESKRMAT